MAKSLQKTLTPEKALIFRITHRSNLGWILQNGLHSSRSEVRDPDFVSIGNPDLIDRRRRRKVPIRPRGTLDEYIPFYFTPHTPMLYNIRTGYGGIQQRENEEIVILASSLPALEETGTRYVFTDRHALLTTANFFADRSHLHHVDYGLLQRRDFRRDPEDPGKVERYQAEALAYRRMPVSALLGLACYTDDVKHQIEAAMAEVGVNLTAVVRRGWYFQ